MAFLNAIFTARPFRPAARGCVTGLLGLALLVAAPAASLPVAPPEYQIKAYFLLNFAQFVEWPAKAFRDKQAPLLIGVLGEDPFGSQLDDAVRGGKIGLRPLLVRRFSRVDEIAECHILFISASESGQLENILTRLKGRNLLTVGDTDAFNRLGGMVRFVTEDNKIRLRINVKAARASELVISSKLIRPAMIFNPGKD
jgi:hypothetical protein